MDETEEWHVYGTHVTCAMLKLNLHQVFGSGSVLIET
jgi:hypothetical protein